MVMCALSTICAIEARNIGQIAQLGEAKVRRLGGHNDHRCSHRWTGLDRDLLSLFAAEPRLGVLEASRRLRVARGTVQSRLDRLERDGVVTGWAPSISPAALGYGVTAFVTLQITQHAGRDAARSADSPPSRRCWSAGPITGSGDLWCRIVAHSNADLQRVIDQMVVDDRVVRASTLIALAEAVPFRTAPLLGHRR